MKKKSTISKPWDFIPQNDDTRFNFPIGAGDDHGKGIKNPQGKIRSSSILRPPKDKTKGFKKPITQA